MKKELSRIGEYAAIESMRTMQKQNRIELTFYLFSRNNRRQGGYGAGFVKKSYFICTYPK